MHRQIPILLLATTCCVATFEAPVRAETAPAGTQTSATSAPSSDGVRLAQASSATNAGSSPSAAKSPAAANSVETIIVTAEKREENSQRVPIALSAISGASLDSQSIHSVQDLGERVPSLRFGTNPTGGEDQITMRGFGSVNVTNGGDSPVAYSLDGVTLQRSTAVDPEFYDINRIEVLRGPQGTLYGRNSVGGSINVITNHPTDAFEVGLDAEVGDYSSRIFRGFLNAPIVSDGDFEANLRITGVSAQHDGYTTNLSNAPTATHNLDSEDLRDLRGQLDIKLSSDADLLLMATSLDNKGPVASKVQFWETPQRYVGQDFLSDPRKIYNDYPDNASNKVNLYSATLNWNLGWSQLTSISAYETSKNFATNDEDGSNLNLANEPYWLLTQRQLSEEIRLASNDPEEPLRWVAGFYYFWATNFARFAFVDTGLNSPGFPVGSTCSPFEPPPNPPGACNAEAFFSVGQLSSRSWAPFGQLDFDLSKTSLEIPLTLTVGARFSDDEKYGSGELFFDGFPVATGPQDKTWSQWTGKLGLEYQFSDDVMAYASLSRGYLSGGDIIGLAKVYNPEHVLSWEIGEKAKLLDDRLQLNVSAYYQDMYNLQVFIQNGTESGIDNAARARAQGIEAEAILIPIDGLRINLAGALTNAKYLNYFTQDTRFGFIPPSCVPGPGGTCDFSGHKLNQTPPYTLNLGVEYNWQTPIGTITPRADVFWSGSVYFNPDNYVHQRAYHQTDLHLIWNDPSSRYSLDAFVMNLENANIISLDAPNSLTLGGSSLQEPDDYSYYPPRTVGIRFGVKFGG